MEIIAAPQEMQAWSQKWRARGASIALVPTMGYFHRGHLSLMEYGRGVADKVVVSLFVNPTQFGPREDYGCYPRDLNRDAELARQTGVDLLYTPAADQMYPPAYQTYVSVEELSQGPCGASRPGYFRGVATVVLKLLHQALPHSAIFGEKDYQQLVLIRRMVADLNLPVKIVGRPTVREPDGLAMSSRNTYLNPEERQAALCLYRALTAARDLAAGGETSRDRLLGAARKLIEATPHTRLDYVALLDPETFKEVETLRGPAQLVLAVWVGETRLTDNVPLGETQP